jgi:NAD(P)-dependent dehydrogenase (short-subunit alcohol dehydrogenase family)
MNLELINKTALISGSTNGIGFSVASFEAFEKNFFESVRPSSLIKRFETPDEIAALVTFVCSPVASAITGAGLRVDGGVVSSCF